MTLQRLIELRGICTILVTVSPADSVQANPPRGLYPEGFKPGHSLGQANNLSLQKQILRDALDIVQSSKEPGKIVTKRYDPSDFS